MQIALLIAGIVVLAMNVSRRVKKNLNVAK